LKGERSVDAEASCYLDHAMTRQNFSARANDRILKVARTLADLEGSEKITGNHVLEAVNNRTLDRAMWS
jgi:magnesium chelatase family protein